MRYFIRGILLSAIAIILISAAVSADQRGRRGFPGGGAGRGRIQDIDQLTRHMTGQLDSFIARWSPKAGPRLVFSGNLFFAHGAYISQFSTDTLTGYVDALRDAGATRIDLNPTPAAWVNNREDVIRKYDAIVNRARAAEMEVVFNPAFVQGEGVRGFDQLRDAARQMYGEIARRYRPDVFTVIHEPGTMGTRLGVRVSPNEWAAFAKEMAIVVKTASPTTRCSAGVLHNEGEYLDAFLKVPELEMIGFDIYALAAVESHFVRMIESARTAGKSPYIEETWHPAVEVSNGQVRVSPGGGIGRKGFEDLDGKWLRAMTVFASAMQLEAITPFWTPTFFAYGDTPAEESGVKLEFLRNAEHALQRGERTSTSRTYQELAAQFGGRPVRGVSRRPVRRF
jgi:hypothetical protein